ncbi:hypothetical protein GCM10025859_17840 [Alicyclobacillus fastidiosus]|nr:hypothetical protein GCM10025859_17840 [Alicyclobacillus fastidiosus]
MELRRKKTKFALTSIDFVYNRLCELGVPCAAIISPENTIFETLKRAADYGQLAVSKNAQIAVGMITVNQNDEFSTTGKFNQDAMIAVHQMLLQVGRTTEATVHQFGLDQFIIYGTRGSVEQIISYFESPDTFEKIERVINITVSIGFGFGRTAKTAEENARIALYYASKNTLSSKAFLVTDEKEVIGPLYSDRKSYHLKSESSEVLDLAERAGVSVTTIHKLLQFLKLRTENRFTAKDLAEYFEVGRRSAERMLKKFMEHKLVEVGGWTGTSGSKAAEKLEIAPFIDDHDWRRNWNRAVHGKRIVNQHSRGRWCASCLCGHWNHGLFCNDGHRRNGHSYSFCRVF